MEKSKITIHRALSELKLTDAKIEKKIGELDPVGLYQKGKLIGGIIKSEDFEKKAKADFQSITDLIDRKTKLKAAIVKSNGETMVDVGGKKITVADAITFKTIIEYKQSLITRLKTQHRLYLADMNKKNDIVESNAQKLLEAALGKENIKTDNKDVESIQVPYLENNRFQMADPIEVQKKIESLETEISDFQAEVDAILSESNATTFIEI